MKWKEHHVSTYSIEVSGPCRALAFLYALWVRAASAASGAWMHIRRSGLLLFGLGRAAAEAGLAVLSSDVGYTAGTSMVRGAVSGLWRGIGAAVTGVGRALGWLGRKVKRAVRTVSPRTADWLERTSKRVATPVRAAWTWVDGAAKGVGEVAWFLAHTPLVRRATTIAAKAASLVLLVHAASQGAVAAKVVAMASAPPSARTASTSSTRSPHSSTATPGCPPPAEPTQTGHPHLSSYGLRGYPDAERPVLPKLRVRRHCPQPRLRPGPDRTQSEAFDGPVLPRVLVGAPAVLRRRAELFGRWRQPASAPPHGPPFGTTWAKAS